MWKRDEGHKEAVIVLEVDTYAGHTPGFFFLYAYIKVYANQTIDAYETLSNQHQTKVWKTIKRVREMMWGPGTKQGRRGMLTAKTGAKLVPKSIPNHPEISKVCTINWEGPGK